MVTIGAARSDRVRDKLIGIVIQIVVYEEFHEQLGITSSYQLVTVNVVVIVDLYDQVAQLPIVAQYVQHVEQLIRILGRVIVINITVAMLLLTVHVVPVQMMDFHVLHGGMCTIRQSLIVLHVFIQLQKYFVSFCF
jgi:hypothetical protein